MSFIAYVVYLLLLSRIHKGVKCDSETLFQRCCNVGKNKSTDPLKCDAKVRTPIAGVAVELQSVCLSTIDLCCVQSLRDIACESGKQAAKQQKTCNIQPKADDEINYKHCCEACKLGLVIASTTSECKLKSFRFGSPWDNAYEACCTGYTPSFRSNITVSSEPEDICQLLPGELCSHICVPTGSSYKCECRPGHVLLADGKSCKQEISENRCEKYSECDQNCYDNGESLECSCNVGFELLADNKTCADINECNLKTDNCYLTGRICRNTIGSYECIEDSNIPTANTPKITTTTSRPVVVCVLGYRYDAIKNTCADIDECVEQNPCNRNTEKCVNTIGSYHCERNAIHPQKTSLTVQCGQGYVYDARKNACQDINECLSNPCFSYEECLNQRGGYECVCKTGFRRDPLLGACVDVNECQTKKHICLEAQRCDNTVGSYLCVWMTSCGTGYTLNSETGNCEDDDECALGIDNCAILGPEFQCKNTQGSFRCERKTCDPSHANCGKPIKCPLGFENVNGQCVDVDECVKPNACPSNQQCVNRIGGYKCIQRLSCGPGERLNHNQTLCIDIDECAEQPTICDHICRNVWSSYHCECNPGFKLHSDNRSCIDINECELYKDRRLCVGHCVNTPGSYDCQCPSGYRKSSYGNVHVCDDINECETLCKNPNETCLNTRGSYRCNVINCPANYLRDTSQKNRCVRVKDFCYVNPNCSQWPWNYNFAYLAFTSDFPIPASGEMEFYRLRGSSYDTTIQGSINLKSVHAPEGINRVTLDYFKLKTPRFNEVVISLVRPMQGPQDIELELKTQYYVKSVESYHSITKLFLYVSQYDF